ncbi:tagatose-bisphosphate aldolase [Trichococcus shcherbakoviae]|uniref:Tagatose 1,6-diphosphate aldolase n=1 Tax=Trichococcus shcherbakoviae subsp. psychrophilus TaxID=2585775 RepID=A0A5C5E6E9_9LACT|nr:tagatose-bisphosphate aldolase [Trichococcus shcherbakoviae]OUL07638.1 tagatose-bisphosphate aldolase [Sedimentibacter sp. SX930]TNV68088.1 tagatose-bisphosphate aldolase [Trichococcus shcherbakoviae subsp. psychrophilus]
MHILTKGKYEYLKKVSDRNNVIAALAIDQRGSLKKMIADNSTTDIGDEGIINFKKLVSQELTKYSSSILLDPEYGLPAAGLRDENAGLLISYEETGYDATEVGRLPDLLGFWSAKRIKEIPADAVKILLYYDIDEDEAINDQKHGFVERVGSECIAEDIPFFLEIVTYDASNIDVNSPEYAKLKPRKVIESMKVFSDPRYAVDVLKMEVPVNMNYVEGFSKGEVVHTREEALAFFKDQSEATELPFIFLSAGVSAELFQKTLEFAKEGESTFNGVLCGRATWKDSVVIFARDGEDAAIEWLQTVGRKNIEDLNAVIEKTATPWTEKITVE